MDLTKINGNTYYIPAPTNIGVYVFKDKYTLLIDNGDNQQGRRIAGVLQANNLNVKYIVNTHNHIDHAGGNSFFQEHYPGSWFLASPEERLVLENGHLFPTYLYGAHPPRELARHFLKDKGLRVDEVLIPGTCKINEERFEVISLPGHAPGLLGIGTRDRVCFLGDALFSEEIITKYSYPFLYNIEAQLHTYQVIDELDYDYFVLGHAERVYDRAGILTLNQANRDNLEYYLDLIRDLLAQPHTREELLEEVTILAELQMDFKEYYYSLSTMGAIVTHLSDKGELEYQLENGKLYFYRR
ncbi:MAG: MBL fold metallo-hydrolase [Syntrophomonadaceae bacterium]